MASEEAEEEVEITSLKGRRSSLNKLPLSFPFLPALRDYLKGLRGFLFSFDLGGAFGGHSKKRGSTVSHLEDEIFISRKRKQAILTACLFKRTF